MGFIDITIVDIIDIWVVALILFQIYRLTRGTNALRIVVGILIVYLLWVVVSALNMELLSKILGQIIGVGVIALIVVFQQEIRRFLLLLGTQYAHRRHTLFGRFFKSSKQREVSLEWIEPLVDACVDMAATKTGALIVIERFVGLQNLSERGVKLDALLTSALIRTIFFKNSPLHDGAVILSEGRILAAKCVLPSTEREVLSGEFGLRHRAALGISEMTDALVIVVSEERGTICIARKGHLRQNLTAIQLRTHLHKVLSIV